MNLQLFRSWAPSLEASLNDHDEGGLNDLWEKITTGGAQFWPGEGGCAITQVSDDGPTRVITYWIVAGALSAVLALRPGVEAWARAWGCNEARFQPARPAWVRALGAVGYRHVDDMMVKEL